MDVLVNNAGRGVWGDFARETDLDNEIAMIHLNAAPADDLRAGRLDNCSPDQIPQQDVAHMGRQNWLQRLLALIEYRVCVHGIDNLNKETSSSYCRG